MKYKTSIKILEIIKIIKRGQHVLSTPRETVYTKLSFWVITKSETLPRGRWSASKRIQACGSDHGKTIIVEDTV